MMRLTRSTRLTESAEEYISRISGYLVDTWKHYQRDNTPSEYWENERDAILDESEFRWTSTGSGRIVCGISRTLDGEFATEDGTPIVVKFEPWIDTGEADAARHDNPHEVQIWRQAVELGDTDLFAPAIARGTEYRWLAMEECLPIFSGHPGPLDDGHGGDYLVSKMMGDDPDYISQLKDRFEERGWYEHDFKHGNIGLREDGTVVLLDYGSFTQPPDE